MKWSRNVRPVPARFAIKGRRARSTVLVFWLSRPGRVEFVVLRAGSCRRIGAFGARGHRGVNRVRFGGRLEGRRLGPGTYTIAPLVYRSDSVTELERVSIQILRPGAKVPLWRRTALVPKSCTDAAIGDLTGGSSDGSSVFALWAPQGMAALGRGGSASGSEASAGGVKSAERTVRPSGTEKPVDDDSSGGDRISIPLPFGGDADDSGPSTAVAAALLVALALQIAAAIIAITRLLRRRLGH